MTLLASPELGRDRVTENEPPNVEYGDRETALGNEILRTVVGSGLHGIAIAGTDDHDEMGIYIEPPELSLGVRVAFDKARDQGYRDSYVWRTQPEGSRSGPGDTDLVLCELRKFLTLAVKGNPTVLLPLFAPPDQVLRSSPVGDSLRVMRQLFLSAYAVERFLHYMWAQHDRMLGYGRRSAVPNRPELVEAYGFDCYLDDTEFLTRRGWKTYDEIGDEDVATVNDIGQIEFQRPVERVSKPYSGPIHFGRTRYSSWAVTPNHRMWVSKIERGACGVHGDAYAPERARWEFRRADEIQAVSWHQRVAGARRDDEYPVSDAYLALVGAYVSEGCVAKRLSTGDPSVLRFEQKDGGRLHDTVKIIESEFPLRSFRYPERRPVTAWTLAHRDVARDVAKACGEGSHHKRLPEWAQQLSTRQAEVLLTALINGDGTPYRTGGWVYYTASRQLADDVQALGVLAGRRSLRWGPYDPDQMYQVYLAEPDNARQMEGFRARQHLQVEDVEDRRIVCFTVPNERLVTRREGKVAMHGNTKYAAHALRLAHQGCEIARTGHLSLPLSAEEREQVLAVKRGEVPLAEVSAQITTISEDIRARLAGNKHLAVPARPPLHAINRWSVLAHQWHWQRATS